MIFSYASDADGVISDIEISGHSDSSTLCASISMLALVLFQAFPGGTMASGYSNFSVSSDTRSQAVARACVAALLVMKSELVNKNQPHDLHVVRSEVIHAKYAF